MISKGVQSVQSRVVNLSELSQDISVEKMVEALIASYRELYGAQRLLRTVSWEIKGKRSS